MTGTPDRKRTLPRKIKDHNDGINQLWRLRRSGSRSITSGRSLGSGSQSVPVSSDEYIKKNGDTVMGGLGWNANTVIISSDAIDIAVDDNVSLQKSLPTVFIQPESGTADDLVTINGAKFMQQELWVRGVNDTVTITVKNSGNIRTHNGADFDIVGKKYYKFIYDIADEKWVQATTLVVGGSGTVPNGTAQYQHLEWNGASWVAQQTLAFGADSADTGQLQLPNDVIGIAWRNIGDDGNLELKVDSGDFFDFTENNNGPVSVKLRAQHAADPDNSFTITQFSGTSGITEMFSPNQMRFLGTGSADVFNYDVNRIETDVNILPSGDGTLAIGGVLKRFSDVYSASFKFDTSRHLDFNTGGASLVVDGASDSFTLSVDSVTKISSTASLTTLGGNVDVVGNIGVGDRIVLAEILDPGADPSANTGWIYGKVVGGDHTEPFWEDELGNITNLLDSSNVPDGSATRDHLEWNGSAWVAQQNISFDNDTPALQFRDFADSSFITVQATTGNNLRIERGDLQSTGFELSSDSLSTPQLFTMRQLNSATGDMLFSTTGDKYTFLVNSLDQLTITETTIDVENNAIAQYIGWTAAAGQTSDVSGTGITHNLPTGDSYIWRVNGGNIFEITELGAVTASPFNVQNYIELDEMAAPAAGSNAIRLYAKDDGGIAKLFYKQDDGTEIGPLGVGGSGGFPLDYPVDRQGNKSGTVTHSLTANTGHKLVFTATGDCDITLTGIPTSASDAIDFYIEVIQDGTGGHAITFNDSEVISPPTVSTTADTTSILSCHADGDGNIRIIPVINASPASTVLSLNDLSDVTITAPNAGEYLRFGGVVWSESSLLWADLNFTGSSIDDIEDVNIGTPAVNTVLKWDNASSKWVDGLVTLSNMATGTAGKWLKYNDSTGVIEEVDAPAGGTSEFVDNVFRIKDNIDDTRKVAFETGGISASTTRTLTIPNNDGVIITDQGSQTIVGLKTFNHGFFKLGPAAGDVSSPSNGEIWYNSTTNKFRGRQNGINVDVGGGIGSVVEDTSPELGGELDAGGFDIINVDDLRFNETDHELTSAPGFLTLRAGSSDVMRFRRGTTTEINLDSNGLEIASGVKLGFYGTTPVSQQSVGSDTLANLYTALRAYGLIA